MYNITESPTSELGLTSGLETPKAAMPTSLSGGFYLDRLEIRNFGGYHGRPTVFRFKMKSAIFAGVSGSGKSTALDALRLIYNKSPAFNSASNKAGSSDRDIYSYYVGQARNVDEEGNGGLPPCLREYGDKSTSMAVLAVYRSDDGHIVSAARLLYMADRHKYDWINITSDQDLSLKGDFPTWMTAGALRNALVDRGATVHPNFEEYVTNFAANFGLGEQSRKAAFKLFDEAMSLKIMGSINEFSRKYLLPPSTFGEVFESSSGQLSSARNIMEKITRTKAQMKRLDEVVRGMAKWEEADAERASSFEISTTADLIKNHVERRADRALILEKRIALAAGQKTVEKLKGEIDESRRELDRVRRAIETEGGGRIEAIEQEMQSLTARISSYALRIETLIATAKRAGMDVSFTDKSLWDAIPEKVATGIVKAEAEKARLSDERDLILVSLHDAKQKKTALEQDLAELDRSRSNVEPALLRARDRIAEEIGLDPANLPFLCELLQIADGHEEWEGVANRVLGGVGRNILVEHEHFEFAKKALNDGHWGVKVVLNPGPEVGRGSEPEYGTLASKIMVKDDSALSHVAKDLLVRHAGHRCVSGGEFQTVKGFAVTSAGSVQSGGRAEKDDRNSVSDRAHYILGWSIEDRRKALLQQVRTADLDVIDKSEKKSQCEAGLKAWNIRISAFGLLETDFARFDDLDVDPLRQNLGKLEAELNRLQSSNIKDLQDRERAVDEVITSLEAEHSRAVASMGAAESVILNKEKDLTNHRTEGGILAASLSARPKALIRSLLDDLSNILRIDGSVADLLRNAAHRTMLRDAEPWVDFRQRSEARRNKTLQACENRRDSLREKTVTYLRDFPEDQGRLSVSIFEEGGRGSDNRAAWRAYEEDLRIENMPQLEAEYETTFREAAINGIGMLNASWTTYRANVNRSVAELNETLSRVAYDPVNNTRAQIRVTRTKDADIAGFEETLKQATAQMLDEPDTALIGRILEMLEESEVEEDRRRSRKIINLKNWFDIDIEERSVTPDGDLGAQVNTYQGSSGLSGGQGERMAMTLLGAGIAYSFGLDNPEMRDKAHRLLVLDESFQKMDSSSSKAASRFLIESGLQMLTATPLKEFGAIAEHCERIYVISNHDDQIASQPMRVDEVLEMVAAAEEEDIRVALENLEGEYLEEEFREPEAELAY